jgi:hypothetical protein
VEKAVGDTFHKGLPPADVQKALEDGEEPGPVQDWTM